MEKIKIAAITLLIGLGLGAYITRMYWPAKSIETKVETRVQNRTITKIVKQSDGSSVTVIDSTSNSLTNATSSTKIAKPDWTLGVAVSTKIPEISPIYELQIQRRIVGPIFAGLKGTTDGEIGAIVTMEF